jgi:D-alanine--poly(phosphoribitol) ligase subunit 2
MDKIVDIILRELNALQKQGVAQSDGSSLDEKTPLFGEVGVLDSVGLVSLVVAVEQALEDEQGIRVSLADERALSQQNSPYRTVESLAAYAASLVPAG